MTDQELVTLPLQSSHSLKKIALVILVCLLSSCSVVRVVKVDSATQNVAGSGGHFANDTIIRASMWKGRNGKQDILCLCPNGMSRVKITTKPTDVLLGFFTAGFVVTQRIEWDCAQRTGTSDLE